MNRAINVRILLAAAAVVLLAGCGGGGGGDGGGEGEGKGAPIPAVKSAYIVVAWNDLGMHCLNSTYDAAVILPPYNTVWAQVIKRGNPPRIVTNGVKVEYRMVDNTSSADKGLFGQFWQYAQKLFGTSPAPNKGLNLEDPAVSNGLSGAMLLKGDHFQVNGIPVVPVNDRGVKSPYQLIKVTVKNAAGSVVAATQATVPVSDEINCGKCHGATGDPTAAFLDILQKHDARHLTSLMANRPVLCASCHGSPALGLMQPGSSGSYLSQAIHGWHATLAAPPACYDCHPGITARCNRSVKHLTVDGNCPTCHGTLADVAATIAVGSRTPWANEPKCATCHTGVAGVDTGAVLYRNSVGHGGVYCAGCHGSPHAMFPSSQPTDNHQAVQYQGLAVSLGDCCVCHAGSRGGGNDFAEEHAAEGKISACNVCHTGFRNAGNFADWPHQFQWHAR